jgi:hypothetical protein
MNTIDQITTSPSPPSQLPAPASTAPCTPDHLDWFTIRIWPTAPNPPISVQQNQARTMGNMFPKMGKE